MSPKPWFKHYEVEQKRVHTHLYSFKMAKIDYFQILTSKLKANLNFWKISIKSSAGGGLALIVNIPSEKK